SPPGSRRTRAFFVLPLARSVSFTPRAAQQLNQMTDTQQVASASDMSFAQLFEASASTAHEHELGGEGQIVTGVVVRINRDFVIVDIGGKSEGVLNKDEFIDAQGQFNVKP